MQYTVHHVPIEMDRDRKRLEDFLNDLEGEVVAIVPNVRRNSLPQLYGLTRKIDFLFIVEKLES